MADTVYFLSSREQSRLVSTLNLSKVERLSVQPGQLGDESVELVIEHSLDFLPGTCVDHYALQRGGDAISIQKEFCPGFITKERRTEVVQQTGNSAKWFQLQSPLIFDVKASPKAPSSWGIAKETVKGFSSSEMMWSFANRVSSSCLAHQVEGTGNNPGYFSVVSRPGRRSKKWFRSFCEPADIRNNFESAKCFVEGGEDNSFGKSCYVASGSLWGGFQ